MQIQTKIMAALLVASTCATGAVVCAQISAEEQQRIFEQAQNKNRTQLNESLETLRKLGRDEGTEQAAEFEGAGEAKKSEALRLKIWQEYMAHRMVAKLTDPKPQAEVTAKLLFLQATQNAVLIEQNERIIALLEKRQ